MRKQFEELHPLFDLEKDEQGEYTCVLTRVTWLGFELGKKTLQAELDQLNKVLDERTKEWLKAIELGTYFQDAAKPLKDEVDYLKAQLGIKRDQIKGFESEIKKAWQAVDEKNKRIEEALYVLKGLKAENDLWGCDQVEVQIEIIDKTLRGDDDQHFLG